MLTSPQLAEVFADNVMGYEVEGYGTVKDMIEAYRSDDNFNQMRREYERQATADAVRNSANPPAEPGAGPPTAPQDRLS
ncbi:MAG: hypothetical protein U5K77_01765 [Candidatus Saccharibacteria bacterium]|nr:hypothetical protein [Candidatus Saccharibacteria bacterium]